MPQLLVRKRSQGRAVPPKQQHLADLESLHTKIGGLLHVADRQDHALRQAAIAHHDALNTQITALEPKLQVAKPDPTDCETYGRLLQQRSQLHQTILSHHLRHWDVGTPSSL